MKKVSVVFVALLTVAALASAQHGGGPGGDHGAGGPGGNAIVGSDGTIYITNGTAITAVRSTGTVAWTATLSTAGGNQVQTRRFTATAAADGTSTTVGPALNRAANEVARQVAQWIGG